MKLDEFDIRACLKFAADESTMDAFLHDTFKAIHGDDWDHECERWNASIHDLVKLIFHQWKQIKHAEEVARQQIDRLEKVLQRNEQSEDSRRNNE